MGSLSCPADEALSLPCRTSYELMPLRLSASLHLQPSATPSSWFPTPSRPWRPFPQSSLSLAVWVLIFQSRVRTVLQTSRELSHGSVCSRTQGWIRGRLVEGWILPGGRTARKAGEKRKYKKTEKWTKTTTIIYRAVHILVTVAACGSSPHAQCMAGFWLSASDGLVISSESLLGEVGREFPGLREEQKTNNS